MVEDLGEMHINEKRLFHGTSPAAINAICKEGLDWRLHGKNGTAFGQGKLLRPEFFITIKPVLSGYSKRAKTKVLKTNGSLVQVKSIAE